MKRSTDRILTTHAGSLARPADLVEIMVAKESGQPFDADALARRVHSAVSEVVGKQIDAGVDVLSDGEQGKPGFANYVGDRLSGIVTKEGAQPRVWADRLEFPEFEPPEAGTINTRRLACNGPLG